MLRATSIGEEMLETLLESKPKGSRSTAGTIVSVTTHTALIAAAVFATAQARVQPRASADTVRAVYFPPNVPRVQTPRSAPAATTAPVDAHRMIFVGTHIDIAIPPIDITPIDITTVVSKPEDFGSASTSALRPDGARIQTAPDGSPFRADQVDRQVGLIPGVRPPTYPEALRSAGIEGKVVVEFVVDERGQPVQGSVRVVQSDNDLFADAVRVALGRLRFTPAEVGGKKVSQLVQMPFVFTLNR
jgi:periplasmic protein TonB